MTANYSDVLRVWEQLKDWICRLLARPHGQRSTSRAGVLESKTEPRKEKVPSQGLRGTFKNCQRLILAESVAAKL